MDRYYGLQSVPTDTHNVITVGTFDGVHTGHQQILAELVGRARKSAAPATVVTFDPHPREVIQRIEMPLLTTMRERGDALESLDIDRLIIIPFTSGFAEIEAEEFIGDVLSRRIGFQEIIIGYDHAFGKDRRGDNDLLRRLSSKYGYVVHEVAALKVSDAIVSSSGIRNALTDEGDVATVARWLGRYYELSGLVVKGDGRGRTIGYPTANIAPEDDRKVIPRNGVYAVLASPDGDSGEYHGMLNIGVRPTFDGDRRRIEAHLIGFEGDLYDRRIRIRFVERVRNEQRFDGIGALSEQLSRDRGRCSAILSQVKRLA